MKITGLDGGEYSLTPKLKIRQKCSKIHLRTRTLLKQVFPFDSIYEEISLPGSRTTGNSILYADFYLPSPQIIVEVHGEQHYKFNPFFFDSKKDFYLAKARDKNKIRWCDINDFTLVELPYNESDAEWARRIEG